MTRAKSEKPKAKEKKSPQKSSTLILKNEDTQVEVKGFMFGEEVSVIVKAMENDQAEEKEEEAQKKGKVETRGRKSTITDFVLSKLHEGFSMDFTVKQACSYAGISEKAYFRYIKQNPQFRELITMLQTVPFITAKRTMMMAIKSDPKKALEFLERREKDKYSTRIENINTNLNTDTHMVDDRVANTVKKSLGAFGKKLAEMSQKNQAKADKKR